MVWHKVRSCYADSLRLDRESQQTSIGVEPAVFFVLNIDGLKIQLSVGDTLIDFNVSGHIHAGAFVDNDRELYGSDVLWFRQKPGQAI